MKTVALLIGIALLALGVACFLPGAAADGLLFNTFPVSTPLAFAFIVTGAIGVMIGLSRRRELAPTRRDGVRDMRDMY